MREAPLLQLKYRTHPQHLQLQPQVKKILTKWLWLEQQYLRLNQLQQTLALNLFQMSQLLVLQLNQAQQDQTRLLELRHLSLQELPQMILLQIHQLNHLPQLKMGLLLINHLPQLKMGLLLIHHLSLQVLNKPLQAIQQLQLLKILLNQHQPKVMKKQ